MPDQELLRRLEQMQKDWDAAPKEQKRYDDELEGIEDGEGYIGKVENFDMFPGKKDPSALYLKTECSFQNHAEYGGRPISRLDNVMDADKLGYLKQFLYTLGVDVENMSLTDLEPGSDLLNSLLDVEFTFDIYTNKKGYRNWAARARLDDSDLGNTQQQIENFDNNTPQKGIAKPDNCICPDPGNGDFNADCPVAGHGEFDF